jgi:hypothetical protein
MIGDVWRFGAASPERLGSVVRFELKFEDATYIADK